MKHFSSEMAGEEGRREARARVSAAGGPHSRNFQAHGANRWPAWPAGGVGPGKPGGQGRRPRPGAGRIGQEPVRVVTFAGLDSRGGERVRLSS